MKVLALAFCCLVAVQCATVKDEWIQFKKLHNKSYKSISEEQQRFKIFQDNLRKIESHNKKYDAKETTYYMGINKFTDLTFEEFSNAAGLNTFKLPKLDNVQYFDSKLKDAPDIWDWRSENGVTPVKDQGSCAGSWAFSAIGALESRYFIVTGNLLSLSEQQLIDCGGASGCNGGFPPRGFDYVKDYDINSEEDYPWVGKNEACHADGNKNVLANVTGYIKTIPDDEEELRFTIYNEGATASAIDVTENFQQYAGGIFDDPTCQTQILNHGVTVVGYGREDDTDFWIVKNSWGENWGEKGYIKMIRKKAGQCGIAKYNYTPIIEKKDE